MLSVRLKSFLLFLPIFVVILIVGFTIADTGGTTIDSNTQKIISASGNYYGVAIGTCPNYFFVGKSASEILSFVNHQPACASSGFSVCAAQPGVSCVPTAGMDSTTCASGYTYECSGSCTGGSYASAGTLCNSGNNKCDGNGYCSCSSNFQNSCAQDSSGCFNSNGAYNCGGTCVGSTAKAVGALCGSSGHCDSSGSCVTCPSGQSWDSSSNSCVTTYTYSWVYGSWVSDNSCPTTTYTRSLSCKRSDGAYVDNSYCPCTFTGNSVVCPSTTYTSGCSWSVGSSASCASSAPTSCGSLIDGCQWDSPSRCLTPGCNIIQYSPGNQVSCTNSASADCDCGGSGCGGITSYIATCNAGAAPR